MLFNGAVEVGDVSLMMLVMVELHGCFVDGGGEGCVVVWECGEFKCHGVSPYGLQSFCFI